MFIQIDKGIYEKLSEAEKGVIQIGRASCRERV